MTKAAFPDGIQRWPIESWMNGHENFIHRFQKNTSYKITLPESLSKSSEKYRATTKNFQWLIKQALVNNNRLRAMGNGWSFSDVAVCTGGAVDTKSLRLSFTLNNSFIAPAYLQSGKKAAGLFFVQCGMSILQINEKLEAMGRSMKASGASNGQSIAGATATGTHGAAYNFGAVHDTIVGMHIITGPDQHIWLERSSNPVASDDFIQWLGAEKITNDDFFNAALVSFGSFGIIHGILLETDPLFLLEEHSTGEITYDQAVMNTLNTLDFQQIQNHLPYPVNASNKELYHFEVLVNPHQTEANNPAKGIYIKTLYKLPYVAGYPKRKRISSGFEYGDNTLGLVQTILDALGPKLSAPLVPLMVNKLLPLAFAPKPLALGTMGETFNNTKFRGKAASAAIGFDAAQTTNVLDEILRINKKTPFPGALSLRYVKGTKAMLGFTCFPQTCVLEMDGVDATQSRQFIEQVWQRMEDVGFAFTQHWGKLNYNLNNRLIRKMYSDTTVNKWISCRHQLMDTATRNIFTNDFMKRCGLDV